MINKKAVSQYGKDFFEKLNSGNIKKFAGGGMVEGNAKFYQSAALGASIGEVTELDSLDYARNYDKDKYLSFGDTYAYDNMVFDSSGNLKEIVGYTQPGKDKNSYDPKKQIDQDKKKLDYLKAQTAFWQSGAQEGGAEGFFIPGMYGKGAIMGAKNLIDFATQQTSSTKYDKIIGENKLASIDLAPGSANISLFGRRNEMNLANVAYDESRKTALSSYFKELDARNEKLSTDERARREIERMKWEQEEARKRQKKELKNLIISTAIMAAIKAAVGAGTGGGGVGGGGMGGFTGGGRGGFSDSGGLDDSSFDYGSYSPPRVIPVGRMDYEQPFNHDSWAARLELDAAARDAGIRFAAGGFVRGNGMGDNVPALLNGGEFVISKQAAEKVGYGNLQRLNSGNDIQQSSDSSAISRLEIKLDEIFDKVAGVGTININVSNDPQNSNSNQSSNISESNEKENRELARKVKEAVLVVLREEKRLGGMLR